MDSQTLNERNSKESVAIFFKTATVSLTEILVHTCKSPALAFPLLLVAQTVKHLPTMWATRVQSLGREDPLEKEMATHSSTLAWEIPDGEAW